MHPPSQRLPRQVTSIVLAVIACCSSVTAFGDDAAHRESTFHEKLLPLLRTYCFDCHDKGSEIDLEIDSTAESVNKNRTRWMQAIAHLRLGTMPPEDGPAMDADTRTRMVSTIDELANAVNCVRNPNAGRVALRRLNRTEYRNTIRDLTGVDYKPADDFPGDDVGYGFDNIGDVLSLPPLLMEKYVDAAMDIAGEAIYAPPPPEIFEIQRTASKLIGAEKFGGSAPMVMASSGTVALQADVPFGGDYELTLTVGGDQAGDEPVKVELNFGGRSRIIDVANEQAEDIVVPLRLGRGERKIEISFLNDYYEANVADRNFHLYHVKLTGTERRRTTIDVTKLPLSHRQIVFVSPSRDVSESQAAQAIMLRFASRAFRRPATTSEVQRLVTLFEEVRQAGGLFEDAIQVAVASVLVSPHFLFKIERPREPESDGAMPLINNYELATRISYFLWSSMPDDELLAMAHEGTIRDRERLLHKIASMIRDRRSNQFVDNFASQWLQLRNLETINPDTRLFRGFDEEVRSLLWRETLTFFAGAMRDNLPVTSLLDADFTYLNEPLAKFYGIGGIEGNEFRKVSLAGTPRGGLLTHGSVLAVTSNPTRTSPVKRGKWILENLLNTPPPPPPADVPELERGQLAGTLRERLEQHRANPACATCHNMMDPLGFALENFDAVGRWRTSDGVDPIDASGAFPNGTTFNGVDELRQLLSTERKEDFIRALAEKMLIYAIGRGTEYYDKCAIDQIVDDCHAGGDRFAYLIVAIIESDPFQKQGYRE